MQNRTGELEIARHKAEESDQLKSSFLANMSHEIRTPLNAIVGFSSLLNDGALTSEKLDTYITIIQSNSESLLNLIDDILDLAKIEAGQIEINVLPIKISSFLQQVFETFSKINLKNDIKIILTLPDSTNEYYVIADPFRLNQIFNNLLSNALKFTDLGTIEIGVKPIVNELVTVYVKDTGIGIASENKLAIFDRFRKIETDTHNLYRGTGLGLSIVARLVEMMGGSIWVESELNIGSTFYFTMPVMLQTPNAEKTTEAFTSDILGISIDKILIVEDIEVNYLYLVALLKDFNATMLWAKNGDEAIDIARNNNYISVILMDIKLPGINGTETMHEIRKFNSTVPIIAQTAFALNEEKESFLKDGFNGYISKPIRKTELFEVLRHCLKIL